MKTAISSILFTICFVVVLAVPTAVFADGTTTEVKTTKETVCTTAYGGGTTCNDNVKTETVTHTPVKAGLGDMSFAALSGIFGSAAAAFFFLSRSTRRIFLFEQ